MAGERFAEVDETVGIPGSLLAKVRHVLRKIVFRSFRKVASSLRQRLKDGMLADAAEPVFRVPVVRLAAMHDAVPVTAVRGINLLADGMGLVEKVMEEPEGGEAAAGCAFVDYLLAIKQRFRFEGRQLGAERF